MNTPKPAPTGAGSINRAATANGRSDNHSEKGSILPNSNIVTATGDDNKTIPFPLLQDPSLPDTHIDDQDDQALFAKLQVPRVRYDVEVITKLVVYAGESAKQLLLLESVTKVIQALAGSLAKVLLSFSSSVDLAWGPSPLDSLSAMNLPRADMIQSGGFLARWKTWSCNFLDYEVTQDC